MVNNQLLGQVPAWGWYVVLAVGLPMLLLLVAGSLMTARVMAGVMLTVAERSLYRPSRSKRQSNGVHYQTISRWCLICSSTLAAE